MKRIKRSYYPLIIGLIFVALALPATIYLVLTSQEIRGRATPRRDCVSMGGICKFRMPCCPGLKCIRSGGVSRCMPEVGPRITPTPAECVIENKNCGPGPCGDQKLGVFTCEAGSRCQVNTCYPTNRACQVDPTCPPKGEVSPAQGPACILLAQGCGPRPCGLDRCPPGTMCWVNPCTGEWRCSWDSKCAILITPTPTKPPPANQCDNCNLGQKNSCITSLGYPGQKECYWWPAFNCTHWGPCQVLPTGLWPTKPPPPP